jgi:hypothetical protein
MSMPFQPLSKVLDLDAIKRKVTSMTIDGLIEVLLTKGVVVWQLVVDSKKVFVVKDFEAQHRNYVWASQLGQNDALALFFNVKYGIKLYREDDLHRIVYGFLVHEAYQGILMMNMPDVEIEVKTFDDDIGVVGVADLVTTNAVVELKSGKKSRRHLLQLAAYLRALRRDRGYLVYRDDVIEVRYDEGIEQALLDAVKEVRRLRDLVSSYSLNDVVNRFGSSYERFKRRFGVEPSRLLEVLRDKGLA